MAFFNKKKEEEKDIKEETAQIQKELPEGGDSHSYRMIQGPHVTEKASLGVSLRKYVFRVRPIANKIEIKRSIETLYKTKVQNVHVLHMPAKSRRVGKHMGEKSGYKKAVVTLKHGEKL